MGLYNPVGGALSELAQTARVIPAQIGQNELARAELGLKTAGIERDLRNWEQFQKPKLEMEAAKLAEQKQPVTVGMFAVADDPLSGMHLLQVPKDKPALVDTIGDVLGAKPNEKGVYIKADGKPVERWEMESKTGQLQRAMAIYMDPMKAIETKRMRLERAIAAPGVNPEWKAKAEASLTKLNGLTDADRLGIWENHQKRLLASRAPFIDNGGDAKIIDTELARVTGKINAIKDAATKQADREYDLKKFKAEELFKEEKQKRLEGFKQEQRENLERLKASLKEDKPDVRIDQSLKRISDIKTAIAKLEKVDPLTAISAVFAKDNPELQGLIGQKISEDDKKELISAFEEEVSWHRANLTKQDYEKPVSNDDPLGIR